MAEPGSRLAQVVIGSLVGATLGLKTIVLVAIFVVRVKPSLAQGGKLAVASGWIFAFAVVGAVVGAFSRKAATVSMGAGGRDREGP